MISTISLLLLLVLVLIIIIHGLVRLNTNYVYDLSKDRTCNFFEIYDVNTLIKKSPACSNKIHIDDFLPENVKIKIFPEKGWGLVSQVALNKNDIIYKSLLRRFPDDGSAIEVTSKELGEKKIDKDIHCGHIEKKYDLFSYFDCFLNHDNNPSAYHDDELIIDNGNIYLVLRATKPINIGEELTINYFYTNEYIYYISAYISYISKNIQSTFSSLKHHSGELNS